jgi:hypothetical protein
MGRAGRAGIHTEGSVIFADPKIYDGKSQYNNNWLWKKTQELLEPERSEPCISELPTIFEPLKSIDGKNEIPLKTLKFIDFYFDVPDLIQKLIEYILHNYNQNGNFTKENLEKQFLVKISLISAIENFMLSNWDELETLRGNEQYSNIVTKTLGYSLADNEMRTQLSGLFNTVEDYIRKQITEPEKRKVYGRTLYGIKDAVSIEGWFNNNIQILRSVDTEESLLDSVWPILKEIFINKSNLILTNIDNLIVVLKTWISGNSYKELVDIFFENDIKRGKRGQRIDIDKTVDICDNVFSSYPNFDFPSLFFQLSPVISKPSLSKINLGRSESLCYCFQFFGEKEPLNEINKWYCSLCQEVIHVKKTTDIGSVPLCLIIHLKPFSERSCFSVSKDKKNVDFKHYLILQHMVGHQRHSQNLYQLYTVNEHNGEIDGGHYTAQVLL